ncbi:MAG: hypothetical protein NUV65_06605 [Candidatus Roizmanbacteria bacterium]|nr:hypothetical protein [Candidatus Roizmanbacteria bacterium]
MKKWAWFMFALILLLFAGAVRAAEPQYKTDRNPLSVTMPVGYTSLFQSHVFYYEGLFRGIFSAQSTKGTYGLIYADSTNGQIWENSREILMLDKDVGTPRIFIDGQTIRLFYSKKVGGSYNILSVLCNSDFKCSNSERLELSPLPNTWDADDVASPFLLKDGETYWLLYSGWKNDGWKIGAAYSTDAHSWTRCPNNPFILYGDGPFIQKNNDEFSLYYHKPDASGIFKTETSGKLTCDSHWSDSTQIISKDKPYDNNHIITPSVINQNDHTYLFYSGRDTENIWHLIEAIDTLPETIFTVILPGFGSSWNMDALLHGKTIPSQDWKLAPFVHEYDGLLETLNKLHFKEGSDYMLFPYDWRRHVEESADELYTTLKNTLWIEHPGTKIVLIGHSLGGLVGRVFADKHPELTYRLITVGTPHRGVMQVYSPLEAGEISKSNDLLWLGQQILLALEKKGIETDKQTLSRALPVLFDLFPTYNFLIDQNDKAISFSSLSIQSSLTKPIPHTSENIFTIYGLSKLTPTLLHTKPQSAFHKTFQNFIDGEPIDTVSQNGDGLVPVISAQIVSAQSVGLPLDHGEIVYTKGGIQKILQYMPPHLFAQKALSEGTPTIITPSLLFMIQSPISLSVEHDGTTYNEQDGLVFIPEATTGIYTLLAQGITSGDFTIHIGQIAQKNTIWEKIRGKIVNDPPESYTYTLKFDPTYAESFFPSPTPTPPPQSKITQSTITYPTPTSGIIDIKQQNSTIPLKNILTKIAVNTPKKGSLILGATKKSNSIKAVKKNGIVTYISSVILLALLFLLVIKRKNIVFFIHTFLQKQHLLQ